MPLLRRLRSTGWFGAAVIVSLAVSIGVCTAVFTVVSATLFPSLPYAAADGLVEIWSTQNPRSAQRVDALPTERVRLWYDQKFETLALFAPHASTSLVADGERPERVEGELVSGNYFAMLGAAALVGRTLLPEDDRLGAGPAVVLSESLWRSRFRGDAGVIGRVIHLSGRPYTIVGVMPERIRRDPGVWLTAREPLTQDFVAAWRLVGRLGVGASLEALNLELRQRTGAELAADSTRFGGMGAIAIRLDEARRGDMLLVWALGGTAFALYLLALSNLATLFLVRAAQRGRATAVRLTLGASGWRLGRTLLAESLALAVTGAVLGLVVAMWARELMRQALGDMLSGPGDAGIDLAAFGFAAALALFAAVVVGLEPLRHMGRLDLRSLLSGGLGGTLGSSERRTRNVLLAGQVAVTMVLSVLGITCALAYRRFAGMDVGFESDHVVAAFPDYTLAGTSETEQRELAAAALARLREWPALESPTYWRMSIQSYPPRPEQNAVYEGGVTTLEAREGLYRFYDVGPGFFGALGIPLLAGRDFGADDGPGSPAVAIVSAAGAAAWWPGQNPLGRRLKLGAEGEWLTVVGVTRDAAELHQYGRVFSISVVVRGRPYLPTLYRPAAQGDLLAPGWISRGNMGGLDGFVIAARAARRSGPAVDALREILGSAAPTLPMRFVGTLREWQVGAYQTHLLVIYGRLIGAVAVVGLLLSMIGIAGAVSEVVLRRTREIGIRKALGARARHVTLPLVLESTFTALTGVGVGVGALWALGRLSSAQARTLESLLVGKSFTDLALIAPIGILLVVVGAAIAVLRAREADRIHSAAALRAE